MVLKTILFCVSEEISLLDKAALQLHKACIWEQLYRSHLANALLLNL